MCGIIACCLKEGDAVPLILDGLRRLEYRGYDSAGIAVLHDGRLSLVRRQGRIAALEEALSGSPLPASPVGIGHTRWATHGVPAERNAHPHAGDGGSLALIHNGIIENHLALRDRLAESGYRFTSETDSEVLAHLISFHLGERANGGPAGLLEAVRGALAEVRGSYALVVLHRAFPGRLVCARKDNPLVAGIAPHGVFLASDVPALLDKTRDVVFLEDGDVAELTAGAIRVVDLQGRAVERPVRRINWDARAAEKGGYEHFMLKEIEEQGDVVGRTLQGRLSDEEGTAVLEGTGFSDGELARLTRLRVVACGTSLHAGLAAKFLVEEMAGLPVEVDFASEFRYRRPVLQPGELVVAVSQSGETADTMGAVRHARAAGAEVLAICNVEGSSLCREARGRILTDAGPEIGVASTKAFTGQLVAFHLLALKLARARGAMDPEEGRRWTARLRHAKTVVDMMISPAAREGVQGVADKYWRMPGFLFIGRGINYPIALEGALKLKEISYVHAEGYPAGEMKHGPIALISPEMVVVVIATDGRTTEKTLSNIQEIRAREGRVVALAHEDSHEVFRNAEEVIVVPRTHELISPLVNVVPLQYLAYFVARNRGCDIDRPRNLAKSVTVE